MTPDLTRRRALLTAALSFSVNIRAGERCSPSDSDSAIVFTEEPIMADRTPRRHRELGRCVFSTGLLAVALILLWTLDVEAANVTGTKTVSGTLTPGSTVTYTIVLTNTSPFAQPDNPGTPSHPIDGNEFIDFLPDNVLSVLGATATSGTTAIFVATNTVTWNGSIPAGGSVTITITAMIAPGVAPGTVIINQGGMFFDADNNGDNESISVTDDPATPAIGDPTSFTVVAAEIPATGIPTLHGKVFVLLAVLLAVTGFVVIRKRRNLIPRDSGG